MAVFRNTLILGMSIALVSTAFAPAPAEAGSKGKVIGGVIGVIGGAILLNELSKQQSRPARRSRPTGRSVRPRRVVKRPDADVMRTQVALQQLGYDPGTPDGFSGRNTRNAIKQFQQSLGAPETGTLTKVQRAELWDVSLASAPATTAQPAVQPVNLNPGTNNSVQPTNSNSAATITPARTPPSTLSGGIELSARQIEKVVIGQTLGGKESSTGTPLRIYFSPDKMFSMVSKTASGEENNVFGNWFIEREADLLCMRTTGGPSSKACWSVWRGATLDMVHVPSKGSNAQLKVAEGSISFSEVEHGNQLVQSQ